MLSGLSIIFFFMWLSCVELNWNIDNKKIFKIQMKYYMRMGGIVWIAMFITQSLHSSSHIFSFILSSLVRSHLIQFYFILSHLNSSYLILSSLILSYLVLPALAVWSNPSNQGRESASDPDPTKVWYEMIMVMIMMIMIMKEIQTIDLFEVMIHTCCLSVCTSVCVSICLCVYLSVCLPERLSICLSHHNISCRDNNLITIRG